MVNKIEELTTIVKSAQYSGSKKNMQKGQKSNGGSAPSTPAKSKAANQGSKGDKYAKRPPQCWCCGGWGHVIRECPSTGNVKWQELSGAPEGKTPLGKAQGPANSQK